MEETGFLETADIETSSDTYARRFEGEVGEWFLRVQEAATLRMLAAYPGATVLDVGGGHGQSVGALVSQGHPVTVLGSSAACVKRVQGYVESGAARFDVGDILRMPYPDRSFDVVISYRLLPHVERWEEFLRELARVADKAIVVDYPEVRSVNAIAPYLFGMKKRMEADTREFTCFRGRDLDRVFGRLGFHTVDRCPEFIIPMALHRKLRRRRLSERTEAVLRAVGLTRALGSPVIMKAVRQNP